jgi:hypothetical protein
MITPRFSVEQDGGFIVITIHVKHAKPDDMDFYVLDEQFKCRPRGLRIGFGRIVVSETESPNVLATMV